ncbi:hypothetical protein BDW74DRAFT_179194 [Aspergillus multicolor]|uniref:uncharacterized protein n=1 Tax=Aspergillus multicolor TaxID=41759 RepID=UPI003CCDDA73
MAAEKPLSAWSSFWAGLPLLAMHSNSIKAGAEALDGVLIVAIASFNMLAGSAAPMLSRPVQDPDNPAGTIYQSDVTAAAFTQFYQVHNQLLNVVVPDNGSLFRSPYSSNIAATLGTIERRFDGPSGPWWLPCLRS